MGSSGEGLTSERLARTRARLDRTPIIPFTLDAEAGIARVAMSDVRWAALTMSDLMAEVERLRASEKQAREAALDEVQEFVVAHAFDTSVGRRIDDFITALLASAESEATDGK